MNKNIWFLKNIWFFKSKPKALDLLILFNTQSTIDSHLPLIHLDCSIYDIALQSLDNISVLKTL